MIRTIIFDFGDVFINLDQEGALKNAFKYFKVDNYSIEITNINKAYECGLISTETFLGYYIDTFPHISKNNLIEIWNFMLKDFPKHRLDFLVELKKSKQYRLILLSNTNELHIDWIKEHVPYYETFKDCFDVFYLSHEIQLRKPNANIFEFVLSQNKLNPKECLFIDDNKDNIDTAIKLGINTWNIDPKTEDIIDLFKIENDLFDRKRHI